jgi:tetratricopeptide (TPR) repeat protein
MGSRPRARANEDRGRALPVLLAIALAVPLVIAGCRRQPPAPAAAAHRTVILVGLDGADWAIIDPLIAQGRLPAFARLKAAGHAATLVATPPLVSPIIWTTIATGRPPDEHGVLDFMVDLPGGGQAPVGSIHRKVPALWTLFSAEQREVGVVGWWATWPAETVRGTIVSDQLAPQLTRPDPQFGAGLIAPPAAADRLMPLVVQPEQVNTQGLSGFVPVTDDERSAALAEAAAAPTRFYGNRIAHLAAVVAGTHTHVAMAEALLRGQPPPDLLAVYLEMIDTVSHRFVKDPVNGENAIHQAYVQVDAALQRLAAAAPPDAWIIVCSDHGFHRPDAGLAEDPAELKGPATAWHRPYGIAAAAEARQIASGDAPVQTTPPAATVTPLDIAPTVLHAAGLPADPAMTGRVAVELLPPERARATPARKAYVLPAVAPVAAVNSTAIDETALARLQALGYVGSRPSSQAMQNLGEVLYRRGRYEAAERALRSAVDAQPQNLGAWLWLARAQQSLGRAAEAQRSWEQAVRLPEGAGAALLPAVDAAVAGQRPADAQRLLAAAKAAPPAAIHTARAVLAAAAGRSAEAERELRAALRADPDSFDALFRLFDQLQRAGRAREALAPVHRAATSLPGSPRHTALLGEVLLATGDAAGAESALGRALQEAPDSAPVRISLARAQLAQHRPDDALATLQPAPASPDRSLLMGAACSARSRWGDAAAHFQDALQAGLRTPELLNGLGWALHKQGRDREAADALRQSLSLRAQQPQIRELLGTLGP